MNWCIFHGECGYFLSLSLSLSLFIYIYCVYVCMWQYKETLFPTLILLNNIFANLFSWGFFFFVFFFFVSFSLSPPPHLSVTRYHFILIVCIFLSFQLLKVPFPIFQSWHYYYSYHFILFIFYFLLLKEFYKNPKKWLLKDAISGWMQWISENVSAKKKMMRLGKILNDGMNRLFQLINVGCFSLITAFI